MIAFRFFISLCVLILSIIKFALSPKIISSSNNHYAGSVYLLLYALEVFHPVFSCFICVSPILIQLSHYLTVIQGLEIPAVVIFIENTIKYDSHSIWHPPQ
ncbi:hypothetical protein ABIB40_003067 [Pedobacter sp. UYP30]